MSGTRTGGGLVRGMALWRAVRAAGALALAASLTVAASAGAAFGALADVPARPEAPPSTASVTCTTPAVAMYHVDALAQLRRWGFRAPVSGSANWVEQLIGTGWSGLNLISGGDGVIYTIDQVGDLRWYDDKGYAGTGVSWDPASGSVIGTGWSAFTAVISGGNGVLYGVDPSGALHWYRDQAQNGGVSWASGSGSVIGTGFGAPVVPIAGGQGVIFLVSPSGTLNWYRHLDPVGGTASWADNGIASPIGSGWSQFTKVASMGAGILLARDRSGRAWWYRDTDPLDGSASWANRARGIGEGTGWNDAQLITDVSGCTAS